MWKTVALRLSVNSESLTYTDLHAENWRCWLNGERMLGSGARAGESAQCKLTVIPMEGWSRDMFYDQTGLQWIASSPHIPQAITVVFSIQ